MSVELFYHYHSGLELIEDFDNTIVHRADALGHVGRCMAFFAPDKTRLTDHGPLGSSLDDGIASDLQTGVDAEDTLTNGLAFVRKKVRGVMKRVVPIHWERLAGSDLGS